MDKLTGKIVRFFDYIAATVLFVVMAMITVDVVGRYLLSKPIKGSLELAEAGLGIVVFLAISYTALHKGHIAVDLLVNRFPKRAQAAIDSLHSVIGMAVFVLIAWQGWEKALKVRRMNEVTDILGVSVFPFRLIVPLGALLFALVLASQIVSNVRDIRQRRQE